MMGSIPWTLLEEEYQSYGEDLLQELQTLIHSPEIHSISNPAFDAGRHFARTFPKILDSILEYDFRNMFKSSATKSTNSNQNNASNRFSNVETKAETMNKTLDFMR
ncbi:unnamed protein product, partial [Oppiella nova]